MFEESRARGAQPAVVGNPATRDAWIAAAAAATPMGSAVLDVSSGARPYKPLFAHCAYSSHEFLGNVHVIDGFRGEHTKDKSVPHDYVGPYNATGAPSNAFDVVLLTEVLEHVPLPVAAVKELSRVARPGGDIYVSSPFTSGSHQQPYHFYAGFSPEWYAFAAQEAGLEIISIESQGDYFKLMSQEVDRALSCGGELEGMRASELAGVRDALAYYLRQLSTSRGDGAPKKAPCADMFTIGFMVHMRKRV